MNNTKRLASIDNILGGVPQFQCIEGCSDCCGPVGMSRLEMNRIAEDTGLSVDAIRKKMLSAFTNAMNRSEVHAHAHGSCPLLDKETHKCSVYDHRPGVCHLFGAVDHPRLTCPHGRRPEKLLSHEESKEILKEVSKLGHGDDLDYIRGIVERGGLLIK